jgi:hypothetical protein
MSSATDNRGCYHVWGTGGQRVKCSYLPATQIARQISESFQDNTHWIVTRTGATLTFRRIGIIEVMIRFGLTLLFALATERACQLIVTYTEGREVLPKASS